MESDYDIPLKEFYDDTPYVTIEEMKQLLSSRKKKWNEPLYEELQLDEQTGLYYTDYFTNKGRDLLQAHLLVEQCLEHLDQLDWKRITNGYDFDIVSYFDDIMENPLVWIDEIPDKIAKKYVVSGRIAEEKSSEERYRCTPYFGLSINLCNERLKWFVNQLPTSKDVDTEFCYYNVPKDMILWDKILTNQFEYNLWKYHDFKRLDPDINHEYRPFFNPEDFRTEIESIYEQFGPQKAAQIVRLLREDWQDIKVLKLFGIDKLTTEQIEEFRQCLFEGMDRNLRNWDAETPQQTTANNTQTTNFEFLTDRCRKEDKVEAVEAELRAAAKGTAVAMWKTIRTNEALSYLSTGNIAASKIYKALTAFLGKLPYTERNFRDARGKV